MPPNEVKQKLVDYFGLHDRGGSYYYVLTRDKEAFQVGTMTFDDFKEFNEEDVDAIVPLFDQAITYTKQEMVEEFLSDLDDCKTRAGWVDHLIDKYSNELPDKKVEE